MRNWLVGLALGCNLTVAVANAQEVQQVQPAQPVQGRAIQVQNVQVQALPAVQVQIQPAVADRVAIGPGGFGMVSNRLAHSDAVFVGRVVALEPMDIEAPQAANGPKVTYRIAVVQVSELIFGLKKDTQTVRVGFLTQGNNVAPGAGAGIGNVQIQPAIQPLPPNVIGGRRIMPGNFQIQLTMGMDGLFSVNKHHSENFFLSPANQNFINRQNNEGFDNEVKNAKQLSKIMSNPVAALKSDDKTDRYTAAAVLISKYRMANNTTGQPMKLEPIDAEESKLILQALAGGDWTPGRYSAAMPNPYELFNQLGLTKNDGYDNANIATQQQMGERMQKWLDENNGKYRIQKYVVDPNAKVQPGNPAIDPAQPDIKIRPGVRPLPAPLPRQIPGAQPLPNVAPPAAPPPILNNRAPDQK